MYRPKYTITNKILKSIGVIEGAKEVIEHAPLIPSFEKQFVTDAIERTVYHGTHIEGNELSLVQAKKIMEGQEVYGRARDVQEVINYRKVITLLEELSHQKSDYNKDLLAQIHALTVEKIVPEEKVGVIRTTQVVIREEGTGKVILRPPSFVEVPYLLDGFFEWFNSVEVREGVHPVLRAGIAHYVLVSIHPFVEGNGRVSRAFAILVLLREGYDVKRFFALEEHFDRDLASYYEAFYQVDTQSPNIADRDLTGWLEYFCEVLATEISKIKEKVRKLSLDTRLKVKMGKQIVLSERQMRLVEYLSDQGSAIMADLQKVLPMVSVDTVLRDLKDLVEKGIIKKEGSTKAARYIILTKP
ncbi:hypothetical protein A2630_01455 [Candidatus Woesebacteria bacterium RIFCSPHIGHO2_01_FULL_44_10]|uniref:Fido domain-containing protein n=1 Tax=Candidatus Woesebacteria bacterium RIFCSPLOWO2_01_FULL_44_14 TaxID=1802525 RepID=A0A1F8BWL5_9BACT|nr:MAG: hypothetical protein A2630_01455 [Candidatus Woesebacteria bacterium RIFCSPHIGHO2_01_FULL_44_10]OGM68494.1 MAG: hypothetical protein A2975_03180 [Candidatus Woesebacteria bacterium RIFCSPLOWO2_01_FULL_44_14]